MRVRAVAYLWGGALWLWALFLAGCSPTSPPPPGAPSPPGESQEQAPGPKLLTAVTNVHLPLKTRREAVVVAAAHVQGAQQLLNWTAAGLLSNDLRPVLTLELAHAPWPQVRSQAWEMLPPYLDKEQRLLPRLNDFLSWKGAPSRGPALFRHPDLNCIGCHRLNGEGVALGSDLSDIGLRLDAASLLESLLDPSAIITPGYETWLVVDEEENEHVGALSRETAEAVMLRDAKNNEIVIPKARVRQRRQVPVSLMPAGLQQSLTVQDLVDLWLFLQSCRQPAGASAAPGVTVPARPQ